MSQVKAKQLKLAAAGDLLIGGNNGNGTTIAATGNADKVLRVVAGAPAWSLNDNLKSADGFNTVKAEDASGFNVTVENDDASAGIVLASFKSGSVADEKFEFSSEAGSVKIAALGTAADVNVHIVPQGDGEVIIGSDGAGVIQADDGEDLTLLGGSGAGNLFLNGGGSGKIFYASDDTDALREIATLADIADATGAAAVSQTRLEFAGDATFALNAKAIAASVIASVNGLVISNTAFAVNSGTKVVTFDAGVLGYALDNVDKVIFTYEMTA